MLNSSFAKLFVESGREYGNSFVRNQKRAIFAVPYGAVVQWIE
jgi:hypothetical protein